MFLRNLNVLYGIVNGARGTVVRVQSNDNNVSTIDVAFDHSINLPQALCSNNGTYCVNIVRQEFIFRNIYIIRNVSSVTCWAAIVHKIQGLSLDSAVICIDNSIFEHGQAYVALRRVRTLEYSYLSSFDVSKITANATVLQE